MNAPESLTEATSAVTTTALSAWAFASDFLIIIVLVLAFFLFAWYVGRGQLVAILLAFYGAYAIYLVFPFTEALPTAPPMTALLAQVGLYAALSIAFYVILRRVVVSDFLYIGVLGLIALSFLAAAFLIALAYHVFPVADVYTFTPAIDILFAAKQYFFWWFIAPAIGLFFLAR